jgi:hypothetical protein
MVAVRMRAGKLLQAKTCPRPSQMAVERSPALVVELVGRLDWPSVDSAREEARRSAS